MDITAVLGEVEKLIIPAFFGIAVGWATGMTTIWANRRQRIADLADKLNDIVGELQGQIHDYQVRNGELYQQLDQLRAHWDDEERGWRNRHADCQQTIYFLRLRLTQEEQRIENLTAELAAAKAAGPLPPSEPTLP